MKTKVGFKLGQKVTLRADSQYYKWQCKGMSGVIARLPIKEEEYTWYEIVWSDGTGNAYEPHDIVNLETEWDQ
jgi:hypothetical protein